MSTSPDDNDLPVKLFYRGGDFCHSEKTRSGEGDAGVVGMKIRQHLLKRWHRFIFHIEIQNPDVVFFPEGGGQRGRGQRRVVPC